MSSNDKTAMVINNETDLIDYFHSVHNLIRNKFGLYGKAALQFFNFFFVLKIIESKIGTIIDFGSEENNNKCKYSNIFTTKDEEARIDKVVDIKRIIYNSEHRNTFFMNFPIDRFVSKTGSLSTFLDKLNLLTPEIMNQYHVYGRIYEYFIGHITGRNSGSRSGSQIEDLGQFFTSRHIVRYCIAKVNPELKNSKVPKMGDFYFGSGGFITEYIRYMNHMYENIDWDQNIDKLYGSDTDSEILKSARVDIMTLTNTVSTNGKSLYGLNFQNMNTFEEEFKLMQDNPKVDFNFTNPPYGNSGKTSDDDKLKLINSSKIIKQIALTGSVNNSEPPKKFKPTKTKPFLINGDNKESLSLMHGMGVLEKNGIYCGVLKEGVFFDKKFSGLRTQLCDNYEVQYVISVPTDEFLNTTTKTSILIFKNSGKNRRD